MMTGTPDTVTLVPINRIEILNSRDRNMKVFEEIADNIRAIGLKKPITVAERPGDDGEPRYVLVCGEGRLNAFRILGETHIPALVVDVICPEAITLLQAKQFTPDVTRILRNMKAARQVVAVELMIASNTITVAHAEALLKATPREQRTDVEPAEREKKTAPIEQIEKLEKEMSQVQEKFQEAESSYGTDLLNLVVAKGYLTKLLANGAVKNYIGRREPEILTHLELVVNTISMEDGRGCPAAASCRILNPSRPENCF
jgi:ParB-like chromosome segregation protein Spo0J